MTESVGDIDEQYGAWLTHNMIDEVRAEKDQSIAIRHMRQFLTRLDRLKPSEKKRVFDGVSVVLLAFIQSAQLPQDAGPRPHA